MLQTRLCLDLNVVDAFMSGHKCCRHNSVMILATQQERNPGTLVTQCVADGFVFYMYDRRAYIQLPILQRIL